MAIQSFSCADTEALFLMGKSRLFVNIKEVATRRLTQLHTVVSLDAMKSPPGNDFKFYDDAYHVRINDQWRMTFKWGDAGPFDVRIHDHSLSDGEPVTHT